MCFVFWHPHFQFAGNDIKETSEYDKGIFLPTKSPKIHYTDDKEIQKHDEKDIGFYPTIDGKPPKGISDKPFKKYPKDDTNKKDAINNVYLNTNENNKYNVDGYDDIRTPNSQQPIPPRAGPGYFNPDTSKNQYPDYGQNYGQENLQGPTQQHTLDKTIPPELYNVFGISPQHPFRIEHLLQQIQTADQNQGPIGQAPTVFVHPGQSPYGQMPPNTPGS